MTHVACELRHGRWEEVLGDVVADALVSDPPYGVSTHAGQRHGRKDARYCTPSTRPNLSARGIPYDPWSVDDVAAFVSSWATRIGGWMCAMTSHDLVPAFMAGATAAGRTVYAPLSCVQQGMNVRLAGDGPSNWTVHLCVSRPRGLTKWGSLPGAYVGMPCDKGENSLDRSKRAVPGGKPLWLMRAIIRDYTRPGDLVVDPCAGGGTTLIAAALEGRRAIGAEKDTETYWKARARIDALDTRQVEAAFEREHDAAEMRAEGKRQRKAKAQPLFPAAQAAE